MWAVVRKPRTKKPSLVIRGRIPTWMLSRLKSEHGKNLQFGTDAEEPVDIFGSDWYASVASGMHPGDNLRIYRENAGLTQGKLGELLGNVPRQNVSAMEKGRRGISKVMAKKLAAIFGAPVERFL